MKRLIIIIILSISLTHLQAQSREMMDALDQQYTSTLFRGDNAYRLAPMYDPAATSSFNVIQYMQGRVPGLTLIYGRGFTPILSFRNSSPAIFLDEFRVDAQTLAMISMNDIAYIKIFRQPFVGAFGSNSAIAVYTRNGEE